MGPERLFPDGDVGGAAELGAVTEHGVRVWGRWPGEGAVPVQFSVEGQPPVAGVVVISGASDWTGVVELELPVPAPNRPFVCTVWGGCCGASWPRRLATMSGSHSASGAVTSRSV